MIEYAWKGDLEVAGVVFRGLTVEGWVYKEEGQWEHGDWNCIRQGATQLTPEFTALVYAEFKEQVTPNEIIEKETAPWTRGVKGVRCDGSL